MTAKIIDGKAIAKIIKDTVKIKVEKLRKNGIVPCIAVIMVGEDLASAIYVRNKRRACKEVGIESRYIKFDSDVSQGELVACVHELNNDPSVHSILVQLPLPKHIDERAVLESIWYAKDADCFTANSIGHMLIGGEDYPTPCTPAGCMELLKYTGVPLDGLEAVVIGRSNIVGKPIALLLQQANCTVTMCHSHTKNLAEHTKRADIVVCAAGEKGLVTGDMIKEGAIVVDVGINRGEDGKISGDVDFESVSKVAGWITPVPGGVGPMTVAMLMLNVVVSAIAIDAKRRRFYNI